MQESVRTSIRLTPDMHEWYKKEAENIGIPFNALVIFALKQYQREEKVIPMIPDLIKAVSTLSKPQCPNCNGESSPNSINFDEELDKWKCEECGNAF